MPKIAQATQGRRLPQAQPGRKRRFGWGLRSQGGLGREVCGP